MSLSLAKLTLTESDSDHALTQSQTVTVPETTPSKHKPQTQTEANNDNSCMVRLNRIPQSLAENRYPVEVSFSLHGYQPTLSGCGVRLHLIVKFRYQSALFDVLDLTPAQRAISTDLVQRAKDYRQRLERAKSESDSDSKHAAAAAMPAALSAPTAKVHGENSDAFIPYCLIGAVDQKICNWSLTVGVDDGGDRLPAMDVYERIELFTTIYLVQHACNFPFQLKCLVVRIATDGTGCSAHLNLLPRRKKLRVESDESAQCHGDSDSGNGNGNACNSDCHCQTQRNPPDGDFGIFTKKTSKLKVQNAKTDTYMTLLTRDESQCHSGTKGVYTRCYVAVLFNEDWVPDALKYLLVTAILSLVLPFSLSSTTSIADFIAHGLTISLTQAALLFIIPDTGSFTATERIVVFNIMMAAVLMIGSFFSVEYVSDDLHDYFIVGIIWYAVSLVVSASIFVHAYFRHQSLVAEIRAALDGDKAQYDVAFYPKLEALV
jgi:hypothetical protein